jgi:hypothetical protein
MPKNTPNAQPAAKSQAITPSHNTARRNGATDGVDVTDSLMKRPSPWNDNV